MGVLYSGEGEPFDTKQAIEDHLRRVREGVEEGIFTTDFLSDQAVQLGDFARRRGILQEGEQLGWFELQEP